MVLIAYVLVHKVLKRNWRVSDTFETAMSGHIGIRTKRFGVDIYNALLAEGVAEKQAKEWAVQIAGGIW